MNVSQEAFRTEMDNATKLLSAAYGKIGSLEARCTLLESRLAALASVACALLQTQPSRDIAMTRTGEHLGPMLSVLSTLNDIEIKVASELVVWIEKELERDKNQPLA